MSDASAPKVGQRVHIIGKNLKGRVAYVGPTDFAPGKWFGIVLDEAKGRNDGSVQGAIYFKCSPNCGIFVRQAQLVILEERTKTKDKELRSKKKQLETMANANVPVGSVDGKKGISKVVALPTPTATKSKIITAAKTVTATKTATASTENASVTNDEKAESLPKTGNTQESASAVLSPVKAKASIEKTESNSAISTTSNNAAPLPSVPASRSTSSTQLRPTRISQPKPTAGNQHSLSLAVPLALAPKRSKTSVSPTTASFCCAKRASFVETGFLEILQPQFTPGHALRTPSSATLLATHSLQDNNSNANSIVSVVEVEQLREELEMLRTQRVDDKRKLHDLEKFKIQNEHLIEFKTRIMSQHGALQRELLRCRQETRDAHDLAAKYKRELDDIAESIELLTLDKEMAEEKAETIQMELELALERNEELALDAEILRAESEGKLLTYAGDLSNQQQNMQHESFQTTGELLRLEQYNQRLRETVIRLRDTLAQEKQDRIRSSKDLETKYSEINELKKIKETLSKRIDVMERQIIDLNEQVDAALGAESMVTTLAETKLDLEERVKLLEDEVRELEALEEIHEQILESNQDLEADLRNEIDKLNTTVGLLQKQKEAALENVYDREITISKFRELVRNLNEQLQLKDIATSANFSIEDFSSTNSESHSNDFQHVFSSTKAYGRAIEQQLKAVELKLQRKHIDCLVSFVPEDFMLRGGEHDVLLVLLLLQRICEKVDIICSAIAEKFPTACEFGRDAIFEGYSVQRFGFRSRCIFLLKSLKLALEQMQYGLDHCEYEVCSHAAIYRTDLEAQELQIDEFLRLLKAGLLDEHTPCDALERVLFYVNGLHQNLLTPQALVEHLDEQLLYSTLLEVYEVGLDCVNTNAGLLHTIIQLGDEQTQSFQCMQFLMETSCIYKQKLKKLQRRLLASDNVAWTGMQCIRYQQIHEASESLGSLINMLTATAKNAAKDNSAITHEKLWRILTMNFSKYANIYSIATNIDNDQTHETEQNVDTFGRRCLELMEQQLNQLADLLESQESVRSANVHTVCVRHPTRNTLMQRAAQVRQHYEDFKAVEQLVHEREKEIKSLKHVAKIKQQDYSELQIRKEMAEKQLTKLNAEQFQWLSQLATGVEQLERMLIEKEAQLETRLTVFSDQLNNLEAAQSVWHQQQLSAKACATTTSVASNLELQLLHTALRNERSARISQQGEILRSRLRGLTPIYVPNRQSATKINLIERDFYNLKRSWILTYLEINNVAQKRQSVEVRSKAILRGICTTYCDLHPHRAVPTKFGLFLTDELRRALAPE